MKRVFIVISVILVVAVLGVYFLLLRSGAPPTGQTSDGVGVRYKTASFVDSDGIGTKAFSMLIPADWQSEGSVTWVLDNPAMPAFGTFRAWNPNGTEQFILFPNQAFFWSDNPMVKQLFPTGSRYFGAEVRSPLGAVDALKEIALPLFRSDVENLALISVQDLPQLGNSVKTGTDPITGVVTAVNGGKIRVEYRLNGVAMEDELYCLLQSQTIPISTLTGTYTNINWYMTFLESFRAEKGKLDPQSKVFQTISVSAKTDVNWLNKYNQVVDYLIQNQIQQIRNLGQLSSIISQTSNDISDDNFIAWQQNQEIKDQLAKEFSRNTLGIETYNDPTGSGTVELPSGYSSAWVNGLGEYILSDSPSYNPNIGSNLNWQQMTTP
jgi:hypothetical protein